MPQYFHDMLHCYQDECTKKDQCYRYWLAQNIKNTGFKYASFFFPGEEDELGDKCEYFLDLKDY